MTTNVTLDGIYVPSEKIVARTVMDEVLIVPLVAGMGESDDEGLYTLNDTGQAIWERLDGQRNLKDVVAALAAEYAAPAGEIEADVLGLVGELLGRGILAPASGRGT
jgi:hypothetical protein